MAHPTAPGVSMVPIMTPPARPGGGIGLVPQDNLVGRAAIMMWSTDGSVEWLKPWTWFTAARWSRIGGTF